MSNYTLYVVEAPTVEPGQTVSTGGIRKDGKMVAQFRNPVPLEQQNSIVATTETAQLLPDSTQYMIKNIAFDILSALWDEIGYPVLKSQLKCFSQKLINRLSGTESSVVLQEVIEADFETIPH